MKNAAIISRMPESPEAEGYCLRLLNGRVRVELTKRWLDDALRVETERTLSVDETYHVAVTYDGSRLARGVTIFVASSRPPRPVSQMTRSHFCSAK